MSTIQAGYDFFETSGDAYFTLPHGFSVPGEFFHKGSEPFSGIIRFTGSPVRKFLDPRTGKEHKTGSSDTIMYRKQEVAIKGTSGSGTTEIELVLLSLRSAAPIEVRVGHVVQKWDVHVGVSRNRPSAGTMTITQTNEHGGHFASQLTIWPTFTFERRSDGEQRFLDMGAMPIPAEKESLVAGINTLQAAEVPWQVAPPPNTFAAAALTGTFAVARIAHHSHTVVAALPF